MDYNNDDSNFGDNLNYKNDRSDLDYNNHSYLGDSDHGDESSASCGFDDMDDYCSYDIPDGLWSYTEDNIWNNSVHEFMSEVTLSDDNNEETEVHQNSNNNSSSSSNNNDYSPQQSNTTNPGLFDVIINQPIEIIFDTTDELHLHVATSIEILYNGKKRRNIARAVQQADQ